MTNNLNENIFTISVDEKMAKSYFDAISKVANTIGQTEKDIPLSLIINQEGVLTSQKEIDIDYYWNLILPIFEKAFTDYIADRKREGENLKNDLLFQLDFYQTNIELLILPYIPDILPHAKEIDSNHDYLIVLQETPESFFQPLYSS